MDIHEVRWVHYPRVAAQPAARSFIERLVAKGKRPKTVDAYARAIEDLLAYFEKTDPTRVLEADENDLDGYIDDLKRRGPKKRGRGGMIEDASPGETKIRYLTGRKLSDNTIVLRVVACRLFYDFLLRKNLRSDPINPIERGSDGRDGGRPACGPVGRKRSLPWTPPDDVWKRFVTHVVQNEDCRTKAMILLAYDAALRREEMMSLQVDDFDWSCGVVTIRPETTKGGRMRHVPVSAYALLLVRQYIEGNRRTLVAAYDADDSGPLFLSESTCNPGRPLAVGAFNEIMERVRERVGLPALTPHTLRHQRCTILKRAGVKLDDIALFAGHKSIETTWLYIHMAPTELGKRLREKIEPFDAPIRALVAQSLGQEISHDE